MLAPHSRTPVCPRGLRGGAPRALDRSPRHFDAIAAELGKTRDLIKVPAAERDEALSAFAAHKGGQETEGSKAMASA